MEYKIYKITCIDEKVPGIYVGSTKSFVKRQRKHKQESSNEKNNIKLYNTIRDNGDWVNWEIKILEICTCVTKTDAVIREQFFYDKLKADLNTIRPYSSPEYKKEKAIEYKRQHKEKILEYQMEYKKHYYLNNKEAILERSKQYYDKNKQKILKQEKQFRLDNRDNFLEQRKQYLLFNKEKIASREASRSAEKIFCESCELYHRRGDKSKHYKTQNHLANLAIFTDE